ncbi:MAG: glycosyltransferase [Proteobacteria bacterium]|nr:MAG: glycosyltransferase [Pseudomonadota bacterium]
MVPSISIIIPALNEAVSLPALLQRLQPWRRRPGCEIIVVDGGSRDGTLDSSEGLADLMLQSPAGRGSQMNAGADRANGAILWFLHADTIPPGDGLEQITRALESHGWGRFNVRLSGRGRMLRVVERLMNWRSCWSGIATGDQALFVRRDWFEEVGGFPDLPLMEDIAISRSLKRLGRPACVPSVVVTSSRRWERKGAMRTIWLMWRLRLAYFLGTDPAVLARRYDRD